MALQTISPYRNQTVQGCRKILLVESLSPAQGEGLGEVGEPVAELGGESEKLSNDQNRTSRAMESSPVTSVTFLNNSASECTFSRERAVTKPAWGHHRAVASRHLRTLPNTWLLPWALWPSKDVWISICRCSVVKATARSLAVGFG